MLQDKKAAGLPHGGFFMAIVLRSTFHSLSRSLLPLPPSLSAAKPGAPALPEREPPRKTTQVVSVVNGDDLRSNSFAPVQQQAAMGKGDTRGVRVRGFLSTSMGHL